METYGRAYGRTNTASPRVDPPGGSTENHDMVSAYPLHGLTKSNVPSFSVDPPGGSSPGEAAFVRMSVGTSPLTLFVYNSGSG